MGVSKSDGQFLIETSAIDGLIKAIEGKAHELKVERVIQVEVALQALNNGLSLIDVVKRALCQLEKSIISHVLAASEGNRLQTAKVLKIDDETLSRYLQKYGL